MNPPPTNYSLARQIYADFGVEIVRSDFLDRVHIGLDYFDTAINWIAAWVIRTRSTITALLDPIDRLRALEKRRARTMKTKYFHKGAE